jgi:hypothetical protein
MCICDRLCDLYSALDDGADDRDDSAVSGIDIDLFLLRDCGMGGEKNCQDPLDHELGQTVIVIENISAMIVVLRSEAVVSYLQ